MKHNKKHLFLLLLTTSILLSLSHFNSYASDNYESITEPTSKSVFIYANDMKVKNGCDPFTLEVKLLDEEGTALDYEDGFFLFDSSNPAVATIDSQGSVTTLKPGTTTITISVESKDNNYIFLEDSYEISLTVESLLSKPKKPIITNTNAGFHITWNKQDNADGYNLFRKISGGEWSKIVTLKGNDSTSYIDESDIVSSVTYSYYIQSYSDREDEPSNNSSHTNCRFMNSPSILNITESSFGNHLQWSTSAGCTGYRVYRSSDTDPTWTKVAELANSKTLGWTDDNTLNGTMYHYRISAYYLTSATDSESVISNESIFYRLSGPQSITQSATTGKTSIKAKWTVNSNADGYELQYATDSIFSSLKTKKINGNDVKSYNLTGLNKKNKYYVRIRSFKTIDGITYYSPWNVSNKVSAAKNATATLTKSGKVAWELRAKSKQTMYKWDTVQGSCSDGTYGYFTMYNRSAESCKIIKVKLSTMKVVKKSAVLTIAHGNDMTYISDTGMIAVVHSTVNPKRISLINPNTLKVVETKDIKIPSGLSGATSTELKSITGFCGITYNATRKQYVLLQSKTYNFIILNSNFEPISYVKPSFKYAYTYQNLDCNDRYIFVAMSPKGSGSKNCIAVYTWDGKFVSQIATKTGYEMESIFHAGNQYYASVYRSYYKIYYTKEKKIVKVKVKGKTKKVKKTVKVKHKKLLRDNYI